MKYIFLLTSLFFTSHTLAAVDDFINSNSLNENGFGSISVGQTIEEASHASGINIHELLDYSDQECGSYIFGKGGTLNIGKLRLLTTNGIIKRIDVWDENVKSVFNLRLRSKYIKINNSLVKSQTIEPNHYGGNNHIIHLLKTGLILRIHTYDGIIDSYAIGIQPEIFKTEGCA